MDAPEHVKLAHNGGLPNGNYPDHMKVGYTRDDLHAAVIAERDSLAARVAVLEGALRDALDAWATHNESGDQMGGWWVKDARAALTA